jgi:hypothetical protein
VNSTSIRSHGVGEPTGRSSVVMSEQLLLRQRAENDDLVDPVDELRPEVPAQDLHQLFLRATSAASS